MLNWKNLTSKSEIDKIVDRSREVPCAIFKHSTRCSISTMAKMRLESGWNLDDSDVEMYFLDLIAHRDISSYIAEKLEVHHESPQIVLLKGGNVTYDASHLDITIAELKEGLGEQV